jgi:dTDP-4-dehydrorhamnose 3,5-epimerase
MELGPHDILEGFLSAPKSYTRSQPLAGVEVLSLPRHVDDRGLFIELFRAAATHPGTEALAAFFKDLPVAQASFSLVTASDHVKGLHYHLKQSDVWFCPPPSKMKVVLLDVRRDSPTAGLTQVVVLGEGKDALLRIPPGVAHGYRPLTLPCALFYFVSGCFDLRSPDEYRVSWDHPLVHDLWQVKNE